MERPVKRSVSVAIAQPDSTRVLIVQRPADDEDLPDAWGLPAASLREDEDWEATVRRAGREKLGVELKVGAELNRGTQDRDAYRLEMRLYEASIEAGTPSLPQTPAGVTQYQDWQWGTNEDLRPAALRGSLCSRLYLRDGD